MDETIAAIRAAWASADDDGRQAILEAVLSLMPEDNVEVMRGDLLYLHAIRDRTWSAAVPRGSGPA